LPPSRYRHLSAEPGADLGELIAALAPLVHEASAPFADWYFGDAAVAADILREWMARPTAEVFAGRAIVLEDAADAPAGCLLALDGAALARSRAADFAAFCDAIGGGAAAEEVIATVVQASRELFPPVAPDEMYISRVAIAAPHRSRGLGRALVGHALRTYRAAGARRFRLDVSADNPGAIRAYEAAGMRVRSTSSSATAGLTYCAMVAEL
jgi:ribosomal protein S18 acetylase RimI-like enzyme